MRSRVELTQHLLDHAYRVLVDNLKDVTLDEALAAPEGGYRTVLGLLKHTAGWSHVYHSYAFDPQPQSWYEIEWPRGLRDTIVKSQDYLDEIVEWLKLSHRLWTQSLSKVTDEQLDLLRPLHWGATAPLYDIVVIVANHHVYHAGEINQLLSIYRGEAWEEGEEVEENHISTVGHRVRPPWMQNPVSIVQVWQDAANQQDIERLIELSDPNIEIVGPRGSGYGHQLLRDWLSRAGLTLTTLRIFARGNVVVVAQHGVWRSVETGEVTGEADVASRFRVDGERVAQFGRYDSLDEAFGNADLDYSDEIVQN